jgi:mono/diheme cytochrome c family protein
MSRVITTRFVSIALVLALPALAAAEDYSAAKALYDHRCGICHSAGGTGTLMLKRRLGAIDPVLANRTDLTAELVKVIARNGINSMPVFNRGELTNAELAQIATYLARPATERAAGNP